MQELFKQYLDHDISRGALLRGLGAYGLGSLAAGAIADSLTPTAAAAAEGAVRSVRDTGGALFIQQLKAAGVKYYFFNPSTGDAPIFNAIVGEPSIQLIKGIQEGVVVAMADGYARMSGNVGVCSVANIGLPNAMTQLVNAYKDRTPLLLVIAGFSSSQLGRDTAQDYEHSEQIVGPMTRWYWQANSAASIPETIRRAMKFATTPPGGPTFVSIPDDMLEAQITADVIDQSMFNVQMSIRPGASDIDKVARMMIEAKNPLMTVGDEITTSHGEAEVLELAELLGLPVAGGGEFGVWSKPFPTTHPLYLGPVLGNMRFPGDVDVRLNMGNEYGERAGAKTKLISIRRDPTSLGRVSPVDVPLVADPKLAAADLIAAVKSIATADRLRQIAQARADRVHAYTAGLAKMRLQVLHDFPDSPTGPVRLERLAVELEAALEPDTIYVNDIDSGKKMDPFMSFGGKGKTYVANGPSILGWGMSAGAGAKLAQPNRPVVAILGDGAFLFGGPQPLWTQARYHIPVLNIVLNNMSYNNERNRIWTNRSGKQFQQGLDLTCYNGSPDVDYAKASEAFGVEAETVANASQIKPALARAKRATAEGRPYLLNIITARDGVGAGSTWFPPYSVAALRTRKV